MNKKFYTLFLLIFLISGFSGLIYESIWTQYLKLFLGHAAYAQTLVLIIFMGGMAIGSYLASLYSRKWKNLFFVYAVAEGVIGLLALIFHESFTSFLELSYSTVFNSLETPISITIYKWTSAALLILPQSILLGTTFPLMSAAVLRAFPKSPGKSISLLYFTNSLGAGIGVLVSGFYFIKTFGLPGTIRIAGLINIFIAVLVLYLIKKYWVQTNEPIAEIQKESAKKRKIFSITFVLLGVSAFTGMASFIYEIAWIRMLNLVLGTSTHAFELMLSSFIFGLAFGGLWIRKRIDKMSNPIAYLGYVQLIMGIMALSTLLIYGNTFNLMQWLLETLDKDDWGYFLFNLSSNGIALLIMFPATFCAGMTLPLITTILLRTHGEKSIGSVYAWNTVGAIIGVLIAVHVGMPFLGLKGLITLGAGIDIALGLILLFVFIKQKSKFTIKVATSSVAVISLLYSILFINLDPYKMASGVFRGDVLLTTKNNSVIFQKDGKTATASLVLHKDTESLSIRTNGKSDASLYVEKKEKGTIDESTMVQIAIIPMALHPEATTVANIGLGAGITTKTVLVNPRIQSIHTIEIEKEMVNAAKHFGSQVDVIFSDPRSKIVIDDAKSFFASSQKKYDIILSEPSNPWVSGVAGLFSLEFYQLIKQKLNKDGVFAQWLQLYGVDEKLVASVLKAVSQSFPDYEIYVLNKSDCLIVAKKDGLLPPLDIEFFTSKNILQTLQRVDINSVQDIEFRFLGNKKVVDPFLASFSIEANSDYYPILDQKATKARFLRMNAYDLYRFTHHHHPVISMLNNKLPRWDSTKITLTDFYGLSRQANEAMALRDFFLKDNFNLHYSFLPEYIKQEAKILKRSFGSAAQTPLGQNRTALLFNTSTLMIPFLTPVEMEQVWTSLGLNEDTTLTTEERAWVLLVNAASQRDAKTMVTQGEFLLSNYSAGLPVSPKEYLVSAVMLGYIMQGQLDEAQITWYKHKDELSDNPSSIMLFRFLAAQCRQTK